MPTDAEKRLARYAAETFGARETPRVPRIYSPDRQTFVDVMECADAPAPGYVTASTLGLHRHPNEVHGRNTRVEIASIYPQFFAQGAELLGVAALRLIREGRTCAPGVVFPGLVRQVLPAGKGPEHLLFAAPAPFPSLRRVEVEPGLDAHWLIAVPIHDSEARYLDARGLNALEAVLVEKQASFFDFDRAPVV